MDRLSTKRLTLRVPSLDYLDDTHTLVSDYEVVKGTASWPHPADREFTASRCLVIDSAGGFGGPIFLGDELIGLMGVRNGELGYMFSQKHWGQGYATEMAASVIAHCFACYDWDQISADYWQSNPASGRVLEKLGFKKIGTSKQFCKAQNRDVASIELVLSRSDWLGLNPLLIETDRLMIRTYRDSDVTAFHKIASRSEIAYMMQSIPHPFTHSDAQTWIKDRRYSGQLGFCAAVCLKDGTVIGNVGIGGDPVSTMYFIDPAFWGLGYATEAMRGFLAAMTPQFGLKQIIAGAMVDNVASQAVLEKLGFKETHRKQHQPSLRLEPEQLIMYRLSQANLKAGQ